MNSKVMRTHHEGIRIQGYKGTTGTISGRVSRVVVSFRQTSRKQYRDGISESKQAFGGSNACVRQSFGSQIQGIQVSYSRSHKELFACFNQEPEMSSGRKPNALYIVDENLPVNLIPTPEPSVEFDKRREEVQDMIVRILLSGKKRGRPSAKEECNEEAA